jgi:hypothetical protein
MRRFKKGSLSRSGFSFFALVRLSPMTVAIAAMSLLITATIVAGDVASRTYRLCLTISRSDGDGANLYTDRVGVVAGRVVWSASHIRLRTPRNIRWTVYGRSTPLQGVGHWEDWSAFSFRRTPLGGHQFAGFEFGRYSDKHYGTPIYELFIPCMALALVSLTPALIIIVASVRRRSRGFVVVQTMKPAPAGTAT